MQKWRKRRDVHSKRPDWSVNALLSQPEKASEGSDVLLHRLPPLLFWELLLSQTELDWLFPLEKTTRVISVTAPEEWRRGTNDSEVERAFSHRAPKHYLLLASEDVFVK